MIDSPDLVVNTLGASAFDSPLGELLNQHERSEHYVEESDRVLFDDTLSAAAARNSPPGELPGFEPAGPRRKIFFDPAKTRAGILTWAVVLNGLERMGINLMFVIGGDGTIRAAMKIVREVARRGSRIAVIGIPKTI